MKELHVKGLIGFGPLHELSPVNDFAVQRNGEMDNLLYFVYSCMTLH